MIRTLQKILLVLPLLFVSCLDKAMNSRDFDQLKGEFERTIEVGQSKSDITKFVDDYSIDQFNLTLDEAKFMGIVDDAKLTGLNISSCLHLRLVSPVNSNQSDGSHYHYYLFFDSGLILRFIYTDFAHSAL